MSEEINSQAFGVTLKAGKGYDAPWIVIRGESASEVHDRVVAVAESGLGATVGQAAKAFAAAYEFGHQLGAEPINPPGKKAESEEGEAEQKAPVKKSPAKKAPAKKAEPEEVSKEAPTEEAVEEPAPEKPAAARTKPPAKKWQRKA